MDTRRHHSDTDDLGFDESHSRTVEILGTLVPYWISRRAVAVSVRTDRDRYDRGDPVEITVDFENRLPVPLEIPTPKRRRWGWRVDGELEASDQRRYTRPNPSVFRFAGGERKRIEFTWNGRLERTGDVHEWVLPDPGEHEIEVFVATHEGRHRPSDTVTITIR